MIEVMENRFIFRDRLDFVYCYNCKTEMAFDGRGYECPVCGSVYKENVAT